ncbi:hypothetical protein LguiA_021918 [Lonicera macranthoides]
MSGEQSSPRIVRLSSGTSSPLLRDKFNFIFEDCSSLESTLFPTTKDTVISASSQVGEQANNDFSSQCATATATATADKPKRRKRGRPTSDSLEIILEELRQQYGKTLIEATNDLGVSVSTAKRAALKHKFFPWLGAKKNNRVVKKVSSSPTNCATSSEPDSKKLVATEATNVIQTSPPPAAELAMQGETCITFKANFGVDSILKFELPSTLKMVVDVEQEVAKRLKIEMGSFCISYKGKYGQWVLITSDDDLLGIRHWTINT